MSAFSRARKKFRLPVLGAVAVGVLGSSVAQAEIIDSVALSAAVPYALGSFSQATRPMVGFGIEAWKRGYDLPGLPWDFHATLDYQPMPLSNGWGLEIDQVQALVGVATRVTESREPWLIPSVSFQGGAAYSFLRYTGATNATLNAGANFIARVQPSLQINVIGKLSLVGSLVYTFMAGGNNPSFVSPRFSIKWSF
jgi:hypothetical protein